MKNKNIRKDVENIVMPGLGLIAGGFLGGIDASVIGYPALSIALPAYIGFEYLKNIEETFEHVKAKAELKMWGAYFVGAATPFFI